jgi:hypothetical protein
MVTPPCETVLFPVHSYRTTRLMITIGMSDARDNM